MTLTGVKRSVLPRGGPVDEADGKLADEDGGRLHVDPLVFHPHEEPPLQGSYTFELVEFKAFQGFSRLFYGRFQGYCSEKKHKSPNDGSP